MVVERTKRDTGSYGKRVESLILRRIDALDGLNAQSFIDPFSISMVYIYVHTHIHMYICMYIRVYIFPRVVVIHCRCLRIVALFQTTDAKRSFSRNTSLPNAIVLPSYASIEKKFAMER